MKSQVTLKTIAKALNLSTSTVSRALADQWDVNSQTKEIVMELATKLNYKPNIMAVKLKQCHKNNTEVCKQPKITIKEMARETILLKLFVITFCLIARKTVCWWIVHARYSTVGITDSFLPIPEKI